MSKGKVIGAIAAVLVIAGAATAVALTTAKATSVQVAPVTRENLAVTVSAAGKVESDARADVYPPTSGTLASVEVTEGQRVTAGQVLAVMDTGPIEVQVAQAQAAYEGALAQRDTVQKSAPSASDRAAAQAAVDTAQAAYSAADAAYQAAKAGVGAPSASDIASAQNAVAIAQGEVATAQAAYDGFYNDVYLPAPLPRDITLENTLAVLALARDQAMANLVSAQQALAALLAASNNSAAIAQTKLARDQAYSAYLGAVAQRDALSKASISQALASANAAVDAAAAARDLAQDILARARMVAPVDGTVLFNSSAASLLGASGGASGSGDPTAGSAVSPAAAPFAIVSFDSLTFSAEVDEADIARVSPGMKSTIALDALPNDPFASTVASIGKESVLTPTGGSAFPVRLIFNTMKKPVLLGMNGSVEIQVSTIDSALTMPVEALLEEGSTAYAYTVRNGRARRTTITIGQLTDTRVEIRSGLSEGDKVIVSGVSNLSDGARVRVE